METRDAQLARMDERVQTAEGEIEALRKQTHGLANFVQGMDGRMTALDGVPQALVDLKVELAGLKARMTLVGGIMAALLPLLLTAAVWMARQH